MFAGGEENGWPVYLNTMKVMLRLMTSEIEARLRMMKVVVKVRMELATWQMVVMYVVEKGRSLLCWQLLF